ASRLMSGCTRTRQLLNSVGLMERLVVLRLEHADLSREFSSSFVLRDLVDLAKRGQLPASYGGSCPRNRSSARVLEECIDIRLGATLALFIRHLARLSSFSKSDRTDRCRRAWQPGNCSSTEIGLTPQGDGYAKLRFVWHTSLIAAARSGLRLSRA